MVTRPIKKSPAILCLHTGMVLVLLGLFLMLFHGLTIKVQLHDTFIVFLYGHLFMLMAAIVFGFGVLHYVSASTFGVHYSYHLAWYQVVLSVLFGALLLLFAMPGINFQAYHWLALAAKIATLMFAAVQLLLPINLFRAVILRMKA